MDVLPCCLPVDAEKPGAFCSGLCVLDFQIDSIWLNFGSFTGMGQRTYGTYELGSEQDWCQIILRCFASSKSFSRDNWLYFTILSKSTLSFSISKAISIFPSSRPASLLPSISDL